jgi:serine/threonine protein kinase
MYRENDTIGPYTLRRKLGKGAFGVVWLAEKRTAFGNFEYALKMAARDDIDLNAVAEEVTTWKDAKGHPNVLPLIDADVYGEDFVIVSEYAPDGSLQAWLNARGGRAPNIETAVAMTEGILDGLIHLHAKRIIHRDLKPDNILLRGAAPMLADFGLARVLKTTQSSNIAGTVQYMSPEALDNKRVEQVDVWSVGVILYQMLSGRLPFAGQGPPLMMSILRDEPAPLPSSVPAGLRQIVARALQKDLTQRQATAQALRDELRAFTEQQAEARRQAAQQPTETDVARLRAEEERRQQAVAERQRQQQAQARRQAEQERQAREAAAERKRRADEEERRKQQPAPLFAATPAKPLWPKQERPVCAQRQQRRAAGGVRENCFYLQKLSRSRRERLRRERSRQFSAYSGDAGDCIRK